MLAYLKTVAASAFHRLREEAGQNLVETALIIGIVSVVLVGAFMATDIQAQVIDVAQEVACTARNGTWVEAAEAAGTCTEAP